LNSKRDSTLDDLKRTNADLQRRLTKSQKTVEAITAERDEAFAQQTATAEVLQVINSSPGDLGPIFDAMLERAMRLCEAAFGVLWTYEGDRYRAAAVRGAPAAFAEFLRQPLLPHYHSGTGLERALRGENLVINEDMSAEGAYRHGDPMRRAIVDLGGARSHILVALRRDEALLGAITIYRQEVRPFTDKQIALLQNFAAQAVIAMENARLLIETREALEQQTATAEVLGVINASPGALAPIFDAMLDRALRLCDAAFGTLFTRDGDAGRLVAWRNVPEAFAEYLIHNPMKLRTILGPNFRDGPVIHIEDLTAGAPYRDGIPLAVAAIDLGGIRGLLVVPLMKDGTLIGLFAIYRHAVRPFSDKQIALLQNFAAQAVIAMENARLITETREALEQQTATAEVLQVINSSPGDLAPVFDAILERAHTVCGAAHGTLQLYDGERLHAVATRGLSTAFADILRQGYVAAESPASRELIAGSSFTHILDGAEVDHTVFRSAALAGMRTVLFVPLRRDDAFLGLISAARLEVRPFTDKQIALLQNFAAQAVIAMENARLITETREALDQQTATAEVLQVINSSPGDLAPVFEAMLEKAMRLCEAAFGIMSTYDGERFRRAALHNVPAAYAAFLGDDPPQPSPQSALGRIRAGERVVHIEDCAREQANGAGDPRRRALAELGGARSYVAVGLFKDDKLQGTLAAYRQEVRPFTDKQIALLQNFAAQAVIAMENARLITETREALEQQTATAEVLGVINSSPGDLAPVFDAMLDKAMRLCGATFGMLRSYDGERFNTIAARGVPDAYSRFLQENRDLPATGTALVRLVEGEAFVHIPDTGVGHGFTGPVWRALVEIGGAKAVFAVSLRKDDRLVGSITVYRQEARAFSDKQIALLQNFAAQAVIAMENARLITETREALEQQTATAEVLGVINSSPGDLAPVFDAMLDKAMRLCDAAFGLLMTPDGKLHRAAAHRGLPPTLAEYFQQSVPMGRGLIGRLLAGEDRAQVMDAADDEVYRSGSTTRQALVDLGGARTGLAVALRKDRAYLGAFWLYRKEVRAFTDKQIALLQNFAAQAVIAMENARLITETREALEQQTATAEVLGVINSSPGDLAPVFDSMLEKATRLCEAPFGILRTWDGECFHFGAVYGEPQFRDWVRQRGPIRPGRDASLLGRIVAGERVVHFADAPDDEGYRTVVGFRDMVEASGIRSAITVALHKDDALLGTITVYRQEVRPFTDKQIALLQNFAAQAVIAMENARLLGDLRERTNDLQEALEYQTATSDVLKVISQSSIDVHPVLQTLVETAARLCDADKAVLGHIDDDGLYRMGASVGFTPEYMTYRADNPIPLDRGTAIGRMAVEGRTIHIEDVARDSEYTDAAARSLGQFRTVLTVPLFREQTVIGGLFLARSRVERFTVRQVELVTTFADQAVIAIENARLLDEIRQRQAELRVTFDNMADGVAMFDEDIRLAAWNRNFQELLDLPDAVLAERPSYADYLRILAERGEFGSGDVEAELTRRLENADQELRIERTRPDGRVIEVRRNAVPDGGFVLIYSDITERKRSEAEIRAARDAAEAAYSDLKAAQSSLIQAQKMAALGQLTAGIAHEIKNPLNFVNNFAGLSVELLDELKETAAPALETLDKNRRADVDETIELLAGNLEKIAEHGKRADNIVKSMLEHSRGVSGERREVDLNGLIEEALNLAYHGARAQDQSFNITLERDFDRALRSIEVAPQEITRVFLNLFGNGFYAANKRSHDDAGESFRPTLTVSTRDIGDAVEVKVRDNGTGIPPEVKDKLFQPFFTTKPTGEGTGLGLSISYDIVTQQHGGTIEVDSEVGEFTEFTIRLPRTQSTGRAAA
jgi:GAF domain-containing protein